MTTHPDVYDLSARVVRRIQEDFAERASEVRRALARTQLPFVSGANRVLQEQIHASVLRLSRGDRARFERNLRQASVDWRDVVVAADLQHPDQIATYLEEGT